MNDVELYGQLIDVFVKKMTSPEIGQFRMETSTFRIILERARVQSPTLIKFTITESGKIVNNLDDNDESLEALKTFLTRSMDFISSLIGEELAKDIVLNSLKESSGPIAEGSRVEKRFFSFVPEPFNQALKENIQRSKGSNDHRELLETFEDVFHSYLKELSQHTDLSAFKLKLSILREEHDLLKHIDVKGNNTVEFDVEVWSKAQDDEVREALVASFNSLVGLSTFLLGKEEAVKKATRIFQYYFEGRDELLKRYGLVEGLLDGALQMKVSTGIDDLDTRMGGGITKGDSILFISPSGIERDIFTTKMLTNGLKGGSSVMMVISKEPPRSIRMLLRSQGMNADTLEEEGNLRIIDWFSWRGERIIGVEKEGYALKSSKILSNLGIAINKGLRELAFSTNKIGLVHIIGPATNIFEFNQVYNFMQRLRAKFKDEEMASVFILESETMNSESKSRIMEVFDGVIELKKDTQRGKIHRELSVVSMSNVDYDPTPLRFVVKDNRIIPSEIVEKEETDKFQKIMVQKPTRRKKKEIVPEELEEAEVVLRKDLKKEKKPAPEKKTDVKVKRKRVKKTVQKKEKEEAKEKDEPPELMIELVAKRKKEEKAKEGIEDWTEVGTLHNDQDSMKPVMKKKVKRKRKKVPSAPSMEKKSPSMEEDTSEKDSQEDIILEAIATIDEILEGPELSTAEKRTAKRIRRKRIN